MFLEHAFFLTDFYDEEIFFTKGNWSFTNKICNNSANIIPFCAKKQVLGKLKHKK
jgi:hypothetical protein